MVFISYFFNKSFKGNIAFVFLVSISKSIHNLIVLRVPGAAGFVEFHCVVALLAQLDFRK